MWMSTGIVVDIHNSALTVARHAKEKWQVEGKKVKVTALDRTLVISYPKQIDNLPPG